MNDKNKLLSMFEIVNNFSLKIEEIILIVITIGLSAVIFIEVICRYIFLIPTAWSEELARYLFILLSFIGAAYAYARHEHIEIDILNQIIQSSKKIHNKEKVKLLINMVGNISTMIFLLFFNQILWNFAMQINQLGQTSPTMRIPMVYVYLIAFLGGALSIVHCIYNLCCDINHLKSLKTIKEEVKS